VPVLNIKFVALTVAAAAGSAAATAIVLLTLTGNASGVASADTAGASTQTASGASPRGGGPEEATRQAAMQRALDIVKAQVAASGGLPGANVAIRIDGFGCKDKAKALELIASSKGDDQSRTIKLWADGMKDQTCRGFAPGLPVKVDHEEGDLSCILPADDPQNTRCLWIESQIL
jgi:hypothetical protein